MGEKKNELKELEDLTEELAKSEYKRRIAEQERQKSEEARIIAEEARAIAEEAREIAENTRNEFKKLIIKFMKDEEAKDGD